MPRFKPEICRVHWGLLIAHMRASRLPPRDGLIFVREKMIRANLPATHHTRQRKPFRANANVQAVQP